MVIVNTAFHDRLQGLVVCLFRIKIDVVSCSKFVIGACGGTVLFSGTPEDERSAYYPPKDKVYVVSPSQLLRFFK